MTWTISSNKLDEANLLVDESLFSLGNGYLGVRGNFEEGYNDEFKSIRGTYINAFHDITEIQYGEKAFGFPETQQKLLNLTDVQTVEVHIDGERFSLFEGEVLSFQRNLHLDKGLSERIIHWKSPKGKEVNIHIKRLVSFVEKEVFAIDYIIEPLSGVEQVEIRSKVDGDVSNYVDKNDPRVASGHAKRLSVLDVSNESNINTVLNKTYVSNLEVACASKVFVSTQHSHKSTLNEFGVEDVYTFDTPGKIRFTKINAFTDTLRHGEKLVQQAKEMINGFNETTFDVLVNAQKDYLDNYWGNSDVIIKGDEQLQEGIRFNLYQLLQSVGKDGISNIAAKGLSGEGYEGHYFWDTEIYIFPVFLMTNPDIAKKLLQYRYSILDHAKNRAKEMGHRQGALFPWRTISGTECSAYFPAGTAQYHISADIAYSYIQYYLATKDKNFLIDFGAEVLFETARLWVDMGHYHEGSFRINDVTGPDEYTCIVNNNYYTNAMAKNNLLWAANVYQLLQKEENQKLEEIKQRIHLTEKEEQQWREAGEKMFLPYDDKLKINPQDDTFLQKEVWDFDNTPKEKYPLLLNYHPLTIYRYQVLKQADTVLAHFLLEDEQSIDTIKASFDYYEKITTHDSSLSYCVYSIMAAKIGYQEKAYDYFMKTARLDLDNTHGNTKDGLHMANMGGTWLAIVYGFAGLRVKNEGLSLNPFIPTEWEEYEFHMNYLGRLINVKVNHADARLTLVKGQELTLKVYDRNISLVNGTTVSINVGIN